MWSFIKKLSDNYKWSLKSGLQIFTSAQNSQYLQGDHVNTWQHWWAGKTLPAWSWVVFTLRSPLCRVLTVRVGFRQSRYAMCSDVTVTGITPCDTLVLIFCPLPSYPFLLPPASSPWADESWVSFYFTADVARQFLCGNVWKTWSTRHWPTVSSCSLEGVQ